MFLTKKNPLLKQLFTFLICTLFLLTAACSSSENRVGIEEYQRLMTDFQENEKRAMQLYNVIETTDKVEDAIYFIEEKGTPAWQENIDILNRVTSIEKTYPKFKKKHSNLLIYCNLRLESYNLIAKKFKEESNAYDARLGELKVEIDKILKQL